MKKLLEWTGTAASIAGAFTVASQVFFLGYVLFLIGAVIWGSISFFRKDWAMFTMQLTFGCANLLGLYNAM